MLTQFVLHSDGPQYTLVEVNGAHLKVVDRTEHSSRVTQLRGGSGLGDDWYDEDHQALMGHYYACVELLNKMVAVHNKPKSSLGDRISEEAPIEAAELVGPNSCEYDHLCEQIEVRLWNEHLTAQTSSASSLG